MSSQYDRRDFLKLTAGTLAAAAGVGLVGTASAQEKLTTSDPTATALHYTEDAATTKEATHKAGSHCANCALYQAAAEKNGYAPCGAFGGKLVASKGWCAAWTQKS
ncbi:high-potential iron-sulfur protein [Solimonas terrae]|uniref:Twin-arginine translocation signal domain-containing protein n=1 Tax=Solimonas terrae TaxID=1396819 RepID=A0A6M2BV53_9GAMM|nr:high-potential iron-sulfur protein [Solimonas terrae]NGY06003.1 twin-arginine translocation signal domain-containing protein [Solimonas terrae]